MTQKELVEKLKELLGCEYKYVLYYVLGFFREGAPEVYAQLESVVESVEKENEK